VKHTWIRNVYYRTGDTETEGSMKCREDRIDEMVLALLYLKTFEAEFGLRAWKSMDWDCMDRLHEKGYISNPKTRSLSVALTKEGAKRSEELYKKHFTKKS